MAKVIGEWLMAYGLWLKTHDSALGDLFGWLNGEDSSSSNSPLNIAGKFLHQSDA